MKHQHAAHGQHSAQGKGHYLKVAAMIGLSFVAMYVLMYAMVDELGNALPNMNQAYMAGLMASPMMVIELALMHFMYPRKRLNAALLAASIGLGALCLVLIRKQAAIGDREFLRSMIPHHAAAILMCKEAPIEDAEVVKLCDGIFASQEAEFDQMKAKLEAMRR